MKLLSILISLCMLLSVCCVAETSEAVAPTVITVRDAVVTIDGEEYPLNPSVVLGLVREDNSALIDVGMPLGDDVLFPIQAKINESGLGLLLGQSDTLYTLTPAFFEEIMDGAEIPDEATTMLEAYGELLSAMGNLDQASTLEQQKAAGEKFMELIGDVSGEEATFFANGEEQTGQRVVFTLTNDQVIEYMDFCFEQMPEGFADAYFNYMNVILSMAGMPEVNGFADILAISGMEMSIDGDMIYNETSGVAELIYHTVVDPSAINVGTEIASSDSEISDSVEVTAADPISFEFPMEITVHTPENMEYSMNMDIEGAQMIMNGSFVEGAQNVSMELSADDMMNMTMDMNALPVDDAAMQFSCAMNMDVEGVAVEFFIDNTPTEDGSTTDFEVSFADEEFSLGAAFTVDVTHDPIADRIAGATVAEINSSEELESNTGLVMAAMSLMGSAEKLMNDESILALVEAVQSNIVAPAIAPSPIEETVAIADNTGSAPMPEFGWLPDGYEVAESSIQPDISYSSFYIEKNLDDEYYPTIYIDMNTYDEENNTSTYAVADGSIQPVEGMIITIEHSEDGSVYASTDIGNIEIWLSYYDSGLADEDIIRILSNITFPESAA